MTIQEPFTVPVYTFDRTSQNVIISDYIVSLLGLL